MGLEIAEKPKLRTSYDNMEAFLQLPVPQDEQGYTAEGLEEYIEIGLEITMRNSLTAEEYIEYNELREEVQNYSTQFPEWNLNKAWKFCLVCMVGFAIAKITIELILAVIRLILIGIAGAFA